MIAASVTIAIEPPDNDDALACLDAYFGELAERFESGFDPGKGNHAEDASMAPPNGCFMIARLSRRPVGCGALKKLDPATGEIKRMWVAPDARGAGVAKRLLEELEAYAHKSGMTRVRLDTNRALTQARAMYRNAGYREIARYNDNPYADHWFEKALG